MQKNNIQKYDLICVGGGIMSATLALMLKLLDPKLKIKIFERLDKVAEESSEAWNNSGTGHSALCELNYTPKDENGNIHIEKAISIFKKYEESKAFWAYLVEKGHISKPEAFVQNVPHHSWVCGEQNSAFLKKRYEAMQKCPLFKSMEYSENPKTMEKWFPLIMENRNANEPMAATRMATGTEVNFGKLTELFFNILEKEFDTPVELNSEVRDIDPGLEIDWLVEVENLKADEKSYYDAHHVFIGAGGGALPLLQKVEIEEKEGYGGFPVSGQWLVCKNKEIIERHHAKVYSRAGLNAPPMSTPHLDTRHINGKKELMFGPFAGFSTKFLKEGSPLDLFKSIRWENIPSMWGVFWHNLPLTKYLVEQISMNHEDRINELRVFIKNARPEDWELKTAGQRVQIIKRDEEEGGILEFGTDVVKSKDGTVTTLLGASPGASVAVNIMFEIIETAFPEEFHTDVWQEKLRQMVPFFKMDIVESQKEFKEIQAKSSRLLGLDVLH